MNNALTWIKARLAEPSTHNALGVILLACATALPDPYKEIALAVAGAFGLNAARLPETSKASAAAELPKTSTPPENPS